MEQQCLHITFIRSDNKSVGYGQLKCFSDIFTKLQCCLIVLGICERATNLFNIHAGKDLHTKHVRAGGQVCRNARINNIRARSKASIH